MQDLDEAAVTRAAVQEGTGTASNGDLTTIRLSVSGRTVGVLLLAGSAVSTLRPDATALELAPHRQVQRAERDAIAMRRLLEQGVVAPGLRAAAHVAVDAAAEAFDTEYAVLCLVDIDERFHLVEAAGLPPVEAQRIADALLGKPAEISTTWRALLAAPCPVLVSDTRIQATSNEDLIHPPGMRAYAAIAMKSGRGQIGMIVCGDTRSGRQWRSGHQVVAEKVAVTATLVVENAEAMQIQEAQMKRRAHHDALTGLMRSRRASHRPQRLQARQRHPWAPSR